MGVGWVYSLQSGNFVALQLELNLMVSTCLNRHDVRQIVANTHWHVFVPRKLVEGGLDYDSTFQALD